MTTAVLVISPHLDDGLFSCGHLLLTRPQAVVATVMAGHPGPGMLSEWDRACGFVDGDDPVGRRRDEDRRALAIVGAQPRHLDFLDLPYRACRSAHGAGTLAAAEIAGRLAELIEQLAPRLVLIPLGLLHPDHVLTHQAGVLLHQSAPSLTMWAYMDLPYGFAQPELVTSRLDDLRLGGVSTVPRAAGSPSHPERKSLAAACYASQVDPVRNDLGRDAWQRSLVPGSEQFWELKHLW